MEPDDYQEQQDTLNMNTQTWRDGSSDGSKGDKPIDKKKGTDRGGMGMGKKKEKSPVSIEDSEKQRALWSTPEFKDKYQALLDEINGKKPLKEEQPDSLPTAEELSERFGGSFGPILERFKEQVRFEIEDGTMALRVPLYLDVLGEQLSHLFKNAADPMLLKLKDAKPNEKEALFLEMFRVDIRVENLTIEEAEDKEGQRMLENGTVSQESYYVINESNSRDIDEDGVVGNPSLNGKEAELIVFDEKHERKLKVKFLVFLQVPKK